jgi:RNA-binding protein 39
MIRDKKTGKSKGIAYVEFYEASAALKSMALSVIEIEDFTCKIIPSQADKNRTAAASK